MTAKYPVSLLAALAVLAAGAARADAQQTAHQSASGASAVLFPTLSGTSLSGKDFTLPRDFAGQLNLVFIAFRREQQAVVDTWVPHAKRLAFDNPEVRFYELPTIARRYVLIRPIIEGGMRGGVTEKAARDATITLYTDTGRFRRALALPSEAQVYTLLVDGAGRVRWRSEGPFTAAKGASLDAAVERLLAEPPAGRE
jgi:hypothetical protein